jgi:hypothetical protein
MKMKKLILLSTCLIATAANASVSIHAPTNLGVDFCANLSGTWVGGGTIETDWAACHYKGTAIVSKDPNLATTYNITMDLNRDAGVCPQHETFELPATCANNTLTVATDNADMTGDVNNTGTEANLNGTIFVVIGDSRVEARVKDVMLQKQ